MQDRNKLFYIYTQLIVFLIVVLHAGLGPDVVVLVPPWCLPGTHRSARLCGRWVLLLGVVLFTCWRDRVNVLSLFWCAKFTGFQEVSPVSPVLSATYLCDPELRRMSLWSSVPCQAVLLSLSRPARFPQEVLCVDCIETSGAFCTPFPSAFALGSFKRLQWECFANLVVPDTQTGQSLCTS